MFAERLKQLRNSQGISQESLAKKLGLAQQTYGHWETGRTQPDHAVLIKLADFFDVTIDYLLGRADDVKPIKKSEISTGEKSEIEPDLKQLLDAAKRLTPKQRETLINVAKSYEE